MQHATNKHKASQAFRGTASTQGFDFQIEGEQTPVLKLILDPGKEMVAESGALLSKATEIEMGTIFGDGVNEGGVFKKGWSAVKRKVTGESLFLTHFNNAATDRRTMTITAPIPGEIMALRLSDFENELICQRGTFLAAPKGVDINITLNKRLGAGFFGGEGFIMQKLNGDDWVFLNAGGSIYKHELKEGESLDVDTGCIVAMTKDVDMDIKTQGLKTALFGGEGLFLARLKGPGTVWVQSMPFSRLVQTIGQALPPPPRN